MDMLFEVNEVVRTKVKTALYPKGAHARVVEVHPEARTYRIEFETRGEHPTGDYATLAEEDLRIGWA